LRLPQHHPSDALLLDYAAGSLDEGRAVVVAAHLQYCPSCRRRLRLLEAVGGALLEALPPDPLPDGAVEEVLCRLDDPCGPPRTSRACATGLPPPIDARVRALGGGRWRRVAAGIRRMDLGRAGERGALALMHIAPGVAVPHHAHNGTELTLVLSGGFSDGFGHYEPGDVVEAEAGDAHTPRAHAIQGCVCLLATEGPLRFTGLLPRLAQPFMGL
jgi:putative transcriptional regulator